jgi:hypothetical protein
VGGGRRQPEDRRVRRDRRKTLLSRDRWRKRGGPRSVPWTSFLLKVFYFDFVVLHTIQDQFDISYLRIINLWVNPWYLYKVLRPIIIQICNADQTCRGQVSTWSQSYDLRIYSYNAIVVG